jgi:DNA-binding MarR family transcriptional regulator
MEPESVLERELVRQWRELLERKTRVWGALETELEKRHGLSASEFEVLDLLSEYMCEELPRVQELADHVPVTQSALSRMIGRLEGQDLVFRKMCEDDRRGIRVGLTQTGMERLDQARPTHRAILSATFAEPEQPEPRAAGAKSRRRPAAEAADVAERAAETVTETIAERAAETVAAG